MPGPYAAVYLYFPNLEGEEGGSGIRGHSQPYSKSETNLNYIGPVSPQLPESFLF